MEHHAAVTRIKTGDGHGVRRVRGSRDPNVKPVSCRAEERDPVPGEGQVQLVLAGGLAAGVGEDVEGGVEEGGVEVVVGVGGVGVGVGGVGVGEGDFGVEGGVVVPGGLGGLEGGAVVV